MNKWRRIGLRQRVGLAVGAALVAAVVLGVPAALGAFTTIGPADPPTACLNGNPSNNCNIYTGKDFVWMNGGPASTALDEGTYFFAVGVPGFQSDPTDVNPGTLSTDAYTNRTFSVDAGGDVSAYAGTHTRVGNKIQLIPFDNTTNGGGVYIMVICKLSDAQGAVDGDEGFSFPGKCKSDAFKVKGTECTENCDAGAAADLFASKDATAAFTRSFTWSIGKSVDKNTVTQTNGSPTATFNYTVTVHPDTSTDDGWGVTGDITVTNPNGPGDDVDHVSVTDAIDSEPNAPCTVDQGGPLSNVDPADATIPAQGSVTFPYSCTYSAAPAATSQTNIATVSWPTTFFADNTVLVGNSTPGQASFDWTTVAPSLVDDCIDVTDTLYGGTLSSGVCTNADGHLLGTGTLGAGVTGTLNPVLGPPFTSLDLKYSNTVSAPALGTCTSKDNTATFTTDDSSTSVDSNTVTVTVCNYNAASTIGYWSNHLANSAKTGSWTDALCSKGSLPGGTSCSSNGPWTKQFLGVSVPTNCCVVGLLSNAHATSPTTPGYTATTIAQAAAVFNANNCSNASTSDSNAAACLAAQLLGAELNVANKANTCICTTIQAAITLLTNVGYNGPGSKVTFTGAYTRAAAITLKTALDNFNNNKGCPV